MADSRSGRIAKDVFNQAATRGTLLKQEQEKAHASAAAKIARLKAQRLARDAEAKAAEPAEAAPTRRRKPVRPKG